MKRTHSSPLNQIESAAVIRDFPPYVTDSSELERRSESDSEREMKSRERVHCHFFHLTRELIHGNIGTKVKQCEI